MTTKKRKPTKRATGSETPGIPERGAPWSAARSAVDSYYDLQRLRIAVDHRIKRLRGGEIAADDHVGTLTSLKAELASREKGLVALLERAAGAHPVYPWLSAIRGIGPVLSAGLLAHFDASKARHASSFWKFAGLYPGAKLTKGEKAPYSRGAKTLCWKVGDSFIKSRNPTYTPLYYEAKKRYMKREKMTKGHADMMARRVMVKRFLADFWIQYRKALDLPVDEPYVVAVLGHAGTGLRDDLPPGRYFAEDPAAL